MGRLEALLDALDRGEPGCLALEGEAGIGKTRLLAELRERALSRGHVVLAGAASEFERDLPFSAWVDALDAYVASHALSSAPEWDAELERELGLVLPSVRGRDGGGAVPDERYRTHRAVGRVLAIVAAERPLVLVLDDLHWSDDASLELIAALVGRPPPAPVLLALAARPGAASDRLAAALTGPDAVLLRLEELSRGEAAELLAQAAGADVGALFELAGGNPFFLEQLGRAGADASMAAGDGTGLAGVPAPVAAAIRGEVASLPDRARRLLEAAAVAGDPFDPGLAAAVGELDDADGLEALDDLLAVDLVRATQVPRRFAFRHPLVRQAVYAGTRGGWRLAAHARAVAALSAQGAGAAERAHHVEQCAVPGDRAAIAVLLEAGRGAASRAPAAAARWFEAALRLLPATDAAAQVDVRVELAAALRSVGELDRCRTVVLEATERLPAEATMRRVELTALCAAVEHWQGRHEDAHRRLVRAWAAVDDQRTREAAALQVELVVDALYENDFEQSSAMGLAALETATALGDRPLRASAAAVLALGEAAAADTGSAREHLAIAIDEVERMDDAELAERLETLYYLGWAENYLEHYDAAIAHARRGVAVARATDQGRLLVPLMLLRCYPLEMQGGLAEAAELSTTALDIARLSRNPHYEAWALFELAWARYFAGDVPGAIAAGEASLRAGGRLYGGTMPSAGGGPGWALAVARFELGEHERARELMAEVGGDDMERWIPAERFFNWENLTLVDLALGDADAAAAVARRSLDAARESDLRLPTAIAGRAWAAVALAAGDHAEAARAAEAAVEAAAAIGAGLQGAYAALVLGQALAAGDDRQRAVTVLRDAERDLDAFGSVRVRDEARRALRRLGARAEARGPAAAGEAGVQALSRRENEVCALIVDRLTNREIAARLFLSEKTVESHVRNVFFKLGASSRVEVARIVERARSEPAAAP